MIIIITTHDHLRKSNQVKSKGGCLTHQVSQTNNNGETFILLIVVP